MTNIELRHSKDYVRKMFKQRVVNWYLRVELAKVFVPGATAQTAIVIKRVN